MASDRGDAPTPRPRRRRTDIDPNAPTPPVANERRRNRRTVASSAPRPDAAAPPEAPLKAEPVDRETAVEAPPAEASLAERPLFDAPLAEAPLAGAPAEGRSAAGQPTDTSTREFHLPGGASPAAWAVASLSSEAHGPQAPTEPHRPPLTARTLADGPVEDRTAWLPQLDDRSLDPGVCPFLRAARDGGLAAPVEAPDPANRCAALREVVPQSRRQQELVCLTSGHVDCPRYLRGAAVVADVPPPIVRSGLSLSPAILGSVLVLILAFSASVAFVVSRGGLELSAGVPDPSASPTASVAAATSPSPGPSASPSAPPSAEPTTAASASPSPTPTAPPTATPAPTPEPTPTPRPTSDRYALLTACPDAPRCWIYRVRRGDNLVSIANYFGVPLDSVYDRNPWLRTTGLRQGQELRLPPPTR